MKSYVDYLNGNVCGIFFKARYIDKDPEAETPPSDAMKLGIYFEYLCTGALPKSGEIPEPEMAYKGKANERKAVAYERAEESAKIFKHIIEHYDIKILSKGEIIYDEELGINGVVDIHAEWNGEKVFIDLKYSGLINDKWNEMGWDLDSLHMKDSLMIQGVHYKLLAEKKLGIPDIPFYYFVFSSTEPNDVKIIKQEVEESKRQSHIVAIYNIKDSIRKNMNSGFVPHPSLIRCKSCPIAHKCNYKVDYPLIDIVYY